MPVATTCAGLQGVKGIVSKQGSQSRDRMIGARLRAIRKERTDLSLEAAAKVAQWAPARLSRTENGKRHVTIEEVATLLTAYKIPVTEREEVLAQLGAGAGWWERGLPGVPLEVGTLASYEANANELIDVSIPAVPGLLHTYETAKVVMAAAGHSSEDIETMWMARLRRQQILGTVDYTAYIGESALYTEFGGPDVLRAQLAHLQSARDRGIGIRIVPEHQTQVLVLDTWLWMRFPNTPPVVHVEMVSGGQFLHEEDAEPYTRVLDRLDRLALSPTASRRLITELLKGQG
jgi:transcriptional regulator with XRE-family HTH domain